MVHFLSATVVCFAAALDTDRAAVLRTNEVYQKRARATREEAVKDMFGNTADGDGMTCG